MIVRIKQFDVQMELKTNGLEFEVRDTKGKHLGDLVLNKARLVWCPGKTEPENGIRLSWNKFIKLMEGQQ